jgi:hypothetical protein
VAALVQQHVRALREAAATIWAGAGALAAVQPLVKP